MTLDGDGCAIRRHNGNPQAVEWPSRAAVPVAIKTIKGYRPIQAETTESGPGNFQALHVNIRGKLDYDKFAGSDRANPGIPWAARQTGSSRFAESRLLKHVVPDFAGEGFST